MPKLVDSAHLLYLSRLPDGGCGARVEWSLLLSANADRIDRRGEPSGPGALRPVRFSADAAQLCALAAAMLACAEELRALDAFACAPRSVGNAVDDVRYLETIVLTEAGIVPSVRRFASA